MKQWLIILVCVTLCLAIGQVANADLVVNGSFQDIMIGWDGTVLTIPSWAGWSTTPASEGSNYGLSGLPNAPSIYQAFFCRPRAG
jgi:hypothetical protein